MNHAAPSEVVALLPALKAWRDAYKTDRMVLAARSEVRVFEFTYRERRCATFENQAQAIAALNAGTACWMVSEREAPEPNYSKRRA